MTKPRAFVSRQIFPEALEMVAEEVDYDLWEDELPPPREVMLKKVEGIDGLLCLLTDKVDASLLEVAPNLKVVSQMAVGVDNVDTRECELRGILVGHTPGVLTETVADTAMALLGAIVRRIPEG